MNNPLVECIPNFSEARRPDVVNAIVKSIAEVDGISILNTSSDKDHNLTVVTFVGPPSAVEEAAFIAIKTAGKLINLDEHTGSHPRLGATDVVPFVPISGIEMRECIEMAHRVGERVGRELQIPIYLYENAATRPDRINLEDIRRGQYETLKNEIASNPDRAPDYGPSSLGIAGATVIGARPPLIAFNVYLTTNDVSVAKSIAKAVRHSSGGFHFVKALGMLVDGRAQVSMNFTNFRQTPLYRVVEVIRREAAYFGEAIHHTELVGLIPGEALQDAAAWYMQLIDFHPAQVLENRLMEVKSGQTSKYAFLEAVAAGTPTPGGGSAAAYTGALAAALVSMVSRLTIGKRKYAEVETKMLEILAQSEKLRTELTSGVEEDAVAYGAIMAAMKLPKENEEQIKIRVAALQDATLKAAQVPLETAEKVLVVLTLVEQCVVYGNTNAISDAATAFSLGMAALKSAGYNVRINSSGLSDINVGQTLLKKLADMEAGAEKLTLTVRKHLDERGVPIPV